MPNSIIGSTLCNSNFSRYSSESMLRESSNKVSSSFKIKTTYISVLKYKVSDLFPKFVESRLIMVNSKCKEFKNVVQVLFWLDLTLSTDFLIKRQLSKYELMSWSSSSETFAFRDYVKIFLSCLIRSSIQSGVNINYTNLFKASKYSSVGFLKVKGSYKSSIFNDPKSWMK